MPAGAGDSAVVGAEQDCTGAEPSRVAPDAAPDACIKRGNSFSYVSRDRVVRFR
jgi:hypothetical protein